MSLHRLLLFAGILASSFLVFLLKWCWSALTLYWHVWWHWAIIIIIIIKLWNIMSINVRLQKTRGSTWLMAWAMAVLSVYNVTYNLKHFWSKNNIQIGNQRLLMSLQCEELEITIQTAFKNSTTTSAHCFNNYGWHTDNNRVNFLIPLGVLHFIHSKKRWI